ncbi:PP2C family protein-serine/threonine phosphatase [Micromonospora sp. NPDC047465]|uniref:PP2C family protein-serine/threonine phosphatase n=1 Tax=Micromonospora sp. NPDC047465 TaxID=3154813 RepID=UPI0033DBE493
MCRGGVAHAAGGGEDAFDAEHRGRRLRGVRRDLGAGRHAWYVRDVTEEHTRDEALRAERSRTAFLAQAGSRLGLSMDRGQTVRTTARLPVPYLADLALVVHLPPPPAENRPHWVRYAEGDAPGGGLTVRVAGGGHPSPLVVRADGTVAPLPVGGMPVGALAAARFAEAEARLAPGELLLAYTNGVTEACGGPRGGEVFGEQRLRAALASAAGLPPAALVDRLLHRVEKWMDGQSQDDIAMLAVAAAPDA